MIGLYCSPSKLPPSLSTLVIDYSRGEEQKGSKNWVGWFGQWTSYIENIPDFIMIVLTTGDLTILVYVMTKTPAFSIQPNRTSHPALCHYNWERKHDYVWIDSILWHLVLRYLKTSYEYLMTMRIVVRRESMLVTINIISGVAWQVTVLRSCNQAPLSQVVTKSGAQTGAHKVPPG